MALMTLGRSPEVGSTSEVLSYHVHARSLKPITGLSEICIHIHTKCVYVYRQYTYVCMAFKKT